MLAVLALALAIPLTLLVLGGRELFYRKPTAPAPEVPGLRASLESAASKALSPPVDLGGGRRFILESERGNTPERRNLIEKTTKKLGGVVVSTRLENGGIRLIVQIPASDASHFEKEALAGFLPQNETAPFVQGFYEILLPRP